MTSFSEADKNFDTSDLTEAQRMALRASREAMGPDFTPDTEIQGIMEGAPVVKAGYKIEIHFGPRRTIHGPNVVLLQGFESGRRLNGGGDDLMYWCKDVRKGHDGGCWGPIPGSWIQGPVAWCRHCNATIQARYLTGQRGMKVSTESLANHVAAIWRQLKMNADIYCKYHPEDIRYKICEQKLGSVDARRLRGLFIYPLANIIKDISAGASVESKFASFFRA